MDRCSRASCPNEAIRDHWCCDRSRPTLRLCTDPSDDDDGDDSFVSYDELLVMGGVTLKRGIVRSDGDTPDTGCVETAIIATIRVTINEM